MKHLILPVSLALGLGACGGTGDNGSSQSTIGSACSTDKEAVPFVAGMSRTSPGGIQVAIEAAKPAPPLQGYNTWTLRVTDSNGSPISDATVSIQCAMTHGGLSHGCALTPDIQNQGNGEYSSSNVVFNMAGHWDVTITVVLAGNADGGAGESVTFPLCM